MKVFVKLLLVLGVFATVSACNTVAGIGRDLQSLGGNADKSNQSTKEAPKTDTGSGAVVTPVK